MNEEKETKILSGNEALDVILGGGWSRGRIVEVLGREKSGCTTLALRAIASVQQAGGVAAFVDAERGFDRKLTESCGVVLKDLLVSQPESCEHMLEIVDTLVGTRTVDLVVVDAVDVYPSDATDRTRGLEARMTSRALRKLCASAHSSGTLVMFTRHGARGLPTVWPAGVVSALKFYASIRVELRVREDGTRYAFTIKNKVAPPFQTAEL